MGLLVMATLFGLGDVQEQTSFRLTQVMTMLSTHRARLGAAGIPARAEVLFQNRGLAEHHSVRDGVAVAARVGPGNAVVARGVDEHCCRTA